MPMFDVLSPAEMALREHVLHAAIAAEGVRSDVPDHLGRMLRRWANEHAETAEEREAASDLAEEFEARSILHTVRMRMAEIQAAGA